MEDSRRLGEPLKDDWAIINEVQTLKESSAYTEYSPIKNPVQADIAYSL